MLLDAAAVLLMTFLLLYACRLTLIPCPVNAAVFLAVSAVLPGLGPSLPAAALPRRPQAPGPGDAWQCYGILSAVLTALVAMLVL